MRARLHDLARGGANLEWGKVPSHPRDEHDPNPKVVILVPRHAGSSVGSRRGHLAHRRGHRGSGGAVRAARACHPWTCGAPASRVNLSGIGGAKPAIYRPSSPALLRERPRRPARVPPDAPPAVARASRPALKSFSIRPPDTPPNDRARCPREPTRPASVTHVRAGGSRLGARLSVRLWTLEKLTARQPAINRFMPASTSLTSSFALVTPNSTTSRRNRASVDARPAAGLLFFFVLPRTL